MKIIPSDKIEIKTHLSIEEVRQIMEGNIIPKIGLRMRLEYPNNKELFEGVFVQDRFEIQRIVIGRNSFVPQIKGQIQQDVNGTKLIADLKISSFVITFMILWTSFAFLFLIIGIIFFIKDDELLFGIIPLGMILFMFVVMHFAFKQEKNNSISDLKRILKTQ